MARHRLSPNTVSRAKNLCAFRSCQYWCSQKPKGMREIKKYSSPIQPRSGNSRWQKRQDVRKRSQHKLAVPTPASCLFPFLLPSGIPAGSERVFLLSPSCALLTAAGTGAAGQCVFRWLFKWKCLLVMDDTGSLSVSRAGCQIF